MPVTISVSRHGGRLYLSFPPDPAMEASIRSLPYADFTADRGWSVALCAETVTILQDWAAQGMVDTDLQALLGEDINVPGCHDGVILPGSGNFPFEVWQAWHHGPDVRKMLLSNGFRLGKKDRFRFQAPTAGALLRLTAEGVLTDPHQMLPRGEAVVAFDIRRGDIFSVGDPRVAAALDKHFPRKDVIEAARNHGVDVQFADSFSEGIYYSELERHREGFQPEDITMPLFPYQAQAVAQILQRDGMGLFLSPGLGKTLIGIAVGAELLRRGEIERVVVTPPAAVSTQWRNEILRFVKDASSEDVAQVKGDAARRRKTYDQAWDSRWMIVHHDILNLDKDSIEPLTAGQFLIVDEAHKGANYKAARSKRMYAMARAARKRLAMTGTPVLNEVTEWYAVLGQIASPGCLADGKAFSQRYQYSNRHGGREGFRRLEELSERSYPHFIRWTKQQVATHLPPLDVRHMSLKVGGDYRKALVKAHTEARNELAQSYVDIDGDSEDVAEMTSYGMLRALCSSPELIRQSMSDGAQSLIKAGLIPEGDGPKLDTLRHMAKVMQESGERLVVFTFSRVMADIIAQRLKEDGVGRVVFHGGTSARDRDAAVEAFTTKVDNPAGPNDNPTVFVATDAAAEGLNLGTYCSTLVNFDLPWTAGRLEQRSNRIHRVDGTHSSYLVVNMTLAGTVEDSILRKLETKASIADVLFGERSAQEVTGRRSQAVRIALRDSLREYDAPEVHMESTSGETVGQDSTGVAFTAE